MCDGLAENVNRTEKGTSMSRHLELSHELWLVEGVRGSRRGHTISIG
jgi:hypothetical protein